MSIGRYMIFRVGNLLKNLPDTTDSQPVTRNAQREYSAQNRVDFRSKLVEQYFDISCTIYNHLSSALELK